MKIELEPHEIRALVAGVAEELLKSLAPRLDTLVSPLIQRALPSPVTVTPPIAATTATHATESAILSRADVVSLVGLSASSIRRRVEAGTFPGGISLGGRRVGWRRSDVVAWLEDLQGA